MPLIMNASELERLILAMRLWMEWRLTEGPIETRGVNPPVHGHSHPSGYAAILIPDWEMRQKLEVVKLAEQYAAAQPDLLEALRNLVKQIALHGSGQLTPSDLDRRIKEACAAIDKAEGKSTSEVKPMGDG